MICTSGLVNAGFCGEVDATLGVNKEFKALAKIHHRMLRRERRSPAQQLGLVSSSLLQSGIVVVFLLQNYSYLDWSSQR